MIFASNAITPDFVVDFETNLESAVDDGYGGLQASLWWENVMGKRDFGQARKKKTQFNVQSAQIRDRGQRGGEIEYDAPETHYTEATNGHFGEGLRLKRDDIVDNQIDHAGQWAADIGKEMAYFPQKRAVYLLQNNGTAYDGLPFFHAAHWTNPRAAAGSTYKNLHTGKPLTPDNLASVVAYIRSQIKMANGTPRFLRPTKLIVPSSLYKTAKEVLGSRQFMSLTSAGSTSLSAVDNVITEYGFQPPIEGFELADGAYYIACEWGTDPLPPLTLWEREAFALTSYADMSELELNRINEFEWNLDGRYGEQYGHPFFLHKATVA